MRKERKIVVPGEIIIKGEDYLPGDWTYRDKENIISMRFGLLDQSGRLVKIIPLSGVYTPRRGNVVIGRITDITFNGWVIELDSSHSAFLPLSECPRFLNKNDMAEHFNIGEMMVCKIISIKSKSIDLTIKGRDLGKLEEGMIIKINSNKVPRVIGKEGSMVNLIKQESNCEITVGQNGLIWLKGENIENELLAKEAISFITNNSYLNGLTEKAKTFFDDKKKKQKV